MKTIQFKSWAVVDKKGEVLWTGDAIAKPYPLAFVNKPNKSDVFEYGGHGIAPVLVTITAAKQKRAKRGRK